MAASSEFTVRDFIDLVKELNEHEAALKIKLAKAHVTDSAKQPSVCDEHIAS